MWEVEAGGACGKLVPFSLLKRARRFARLELFDLPIERRECGRKGMRRKGKRVGWVWRGYIVLVVWLIGWVDKKVVLLREENRMKRR